MPSTVGISRTIQVKILTLVIQTNMSVSGGECGG